MSSPSSAPQAETDRKPESKPECKPEPQAQAALQSPTDTLRSAASGLSAHLVYQFSARILSFLIKVVAVRALRPAHFAYVEIRLALIVNLALLPAINGFRPVVLRVPTEDRASALSLFCSLFSFALGLVLGVAAIMLDPANYRPLLIILLAVLVRTFAEISIVFTRRRQRYKEASRARAVCVMISSVFQALAVSLVSRAELAPAASSFSHLAYTTSLAVTMYYALGEQGLPPVSLAHMRDHLRRDDLVMSAVTTLEGVLKFLLENGESIIIDATCSLTVQGAYKLASNLGSLLARVFSEALEEQSFNVFSQLSPGFRVDADGGDEESESRRRSMRKTCVDTLILGLKAAFTVALLFAVIGPCFSYTALRLLYGTRWADDTESPVLLSQYFFYLLFTAANGVSEAFVSASASTAELKARTKFGSKLSFVYLSTMYLAARRYGATGIIAANCFNMAARTVYSSAFFERLTGLSITTLLAALPNVWLVGSTLVMRWVAGWSEQHWFGPSGDRVVIADRVNLITRAGKHGLSGVLAVIVFVAAFVHFERDFIRNVRKLRAHRD